MLGPVDYLTEEEPLGPISTPPIERDGHKFSKESFKALFELENEMVKQVSKVPSVLLGRRGAGKTALLYSLYYSDAYSIRIPIDSANTYRDVARRVEDACGPNPLIEIVSQFWHILLITTFLSNFHKKFSRRFSNTSELETIQRFLERNGLLKTFSVLTVTRQLLKAAGAYNPQAEDLIGPLHDLILSNESLDEAFQACDQLMKRHSLRGIILMDSLERFPITDDLFKDSLQGLLQFISEWRMEKSNLDISVCFPAEIFPQMLEHSDAPEKHFSSTIILHWTANELMAMVDRRLSLLQKHFDQVFPISSPLISARNDRSHPITEISALIPKNITNRRGIVEPTISYIFRHTQLLPRHVIKVLNEIVKQAVARDAIRPNDDDIVRAVSIAEVYIFNGILSSFKSSFPFVNSLAKYMLPNLPLTFSAGDFHSYYNQHGRGVALDHFDALECLIRIGAIGRVLDSSKPVYLTAEFDYTLPGPLKTSSSDMLCLHPVFSRSSPDREENYQPIYPFGSDPSDEFARKFVPQIV